MSTVEELRDKCLCLEREILLLRRKIVRLGGTDSSLEQLEEEERVLKEERQQEEQKKKVETHRLQAVSLRRRKEEDETKKKTEKVETLYLPLQAKWEQYVNENPDLVKELEQKLVLMILNKDDAFVQQGLELLSSIGSFAFCLLLEKAGSEVQGIRSYPSLSRWKTKALKDILRSHNVKISGSKKELVDRINKELPIRVLIEPWLLKEVSQEESDWFELVESGCFDGMVGRVTERIEWSGLSEYIQQKLLQEVAEMIQIEPCAFQMGALDEDVEIFEAERPRHEVNLTRSFVAGKYSVTNALWVSVMGKTPSKFVGSSCSVTNISWFDCVKFCNKLSEKEGLEKAYTINGKEVDCNFDANGYRLPTEAEWEYTARGGEYHLYAGSNNPDEVAWYGEDWTSRTHGVGQKKANGFGLFDMSGNVEEWCWDWYAEPYYQNSPRDNPTGPSSYWKRRVHRGGNYRQGFRYARVSSRFPNFPGNGSDHTGFRLFRSI